MSRMMIGRCSVALDTILNYLPSSNESWIGNEFSGPNNQSKPKFCRLPTGSRCAGNGEGTRRRSKLSTIKNRRHGMADHSKVLHSVRLNQLAVSELLKMAFRLQGLAAVPDRERCVRQDQMKRAVVQGKAEGSEYSPWVAMKAPTRP